MTRLLIAVARCALFACLIVAVMPSPAWAQQADSRMFPQTGYRIGDDAFWTYFRRRGGVRTFGYPVSNPFTLQGFRVQIFQRAILQMQPNGAVAIANVLDDGLLPYTAINGSNFPGPDPDLIARQPRVGEPDYHQKALQFVRDNAPDTWQGMKVSFFQTFSGAVRAEEAFPDGGASDGLLLGFNLEVWGLPTSKPTPRPLAVPAATPSAGSRIATTSTPKRRARRCLPAGKTWTPTCATTSSKARRPPSSAASRSASAPTAS